MRNILLRSPQFLTATDTTSTMLSAKLELSIDSTLQYTIIKNAINFRVVFEISELARDFITHEANQTIPLSSVDVSYTITKYDGLDGTGNTIGSPINDSDTGFDGYGKFSEGANPTFGTVGQAIQTNTDIYLPENTASYNPINYSSTRKIDISTTDTIKQIGSPLVTFTIHRVCDTKYDSMKITFVNKFGALQELYFFFKSTENINITSEEYKANIFDFSNSNYSTTDHQSQTYNINAKESIKLNTPQVTDQYNDVLEELLLSEHVWLTKGSTIYPVKPTTKTMQRKTSVNDKIVQYTMDFDFANSYINDIR